MHNKNNSLMNWHLSLSLVKSKGKGTILVILIGNSQPHPIPPLVTTYQKYFITHSSLETSP